MTLQMQLDDALVPSWLAARICVETASRQVTGVDAG